MKIQLPKGVNDIINQLMDHGYEAYAVGGCIRDSMLNKEPEDWDITTSAKPIDVKRIFDRTVDTGIEHGTVTVLYNKDSYEVTTYRIDGEYEDNRRPNSVEFTSDLAKDLQRRDFTINAMAYNNSDGLVDLYYGMNDLQNGIIRCVGDPQHRFEEDALRILRAFRFSAQLGFEIEKNTYKAAYLQKDRLKSISEERIRTELNKLLVSSYPEKMIDMYKVGITRIILPEIDLMMASPHMTLVNESIGTYAIKTIKILDDPIFDKYKIASNDKSNLIVRWALLLSEVDLKDNGKNSSNISRKILRRLKFDNETINKTSRLIKWLPEPFVLSDFGMRKAVNIIGLDIIDLLFVAKEARLYAFNELNNQNDLENLNKAWVIYKKIIDRGDCINLNMLKVSGRDLIDIGYKPGKDLGKMLDKLLEVVLEDQTKNEKVRLLEIARRYLDKHIKEN